MKAFLLAAGYGKRLRPLTEVLPKPLIEVGGKPLIQYHIENLVDAGVTELVINAHWLANKLQDFLGDGSSFGVSIHWSIESELLETGGGIRNALAFLGDEPFILASADAYLEYSYKQLVNTALGNNLAHLLLVKNPQHNHAGDFCLDSSGHLTRKEKGENQLTYSGVGLISPLLLKDWPTEPAAFPLLLPLLSAAKENKLTGEFFDGLWEDVGTIERLNRLNETLST